MTYSFYLKEPKKKTATPILLIVSHGNRKYKKSIGISVVPEQFKKQRTKDESVNAKLRMIENGMNERLNQFSKESDILSAMEEVIALSSGKAPKRKPGNGRIPLWDYFEEWSKREPSRQKDRNLAYRRIVSLMGNDTDWEDIDGDWYFRFTQKCNKMGYSHNYKSTITAKLKTVMNEGFNRGFHKNEEFRKFATSYKPADAIALTQAEVDALWKARLSGRLAEARDVFIVGVYCAGRFQDYSKISSENIVDRKLRYVQRKTGETVIIPCAPRIAKVLERHGGKLPRITEQEVGRHIKAIAKGIGGSFLDIVEISKNQGGARVLEKHPRWELISTHTARRTGATLLYKSGLPIRICRFLTGHTTDAMFLNYLKIGKEEGAELLAQSSFFK